MPKNISDQDLITANRVVKNFKIVKRSCSLNPIPTGLGHVTFIYGPIPPMAGRNRVNRYYRVYSGHAGFENDDEDSKKILTY